jgi:exodeoxyribonuclease-3
MRIATWNVNSIRARMSRFLPWLEARKPDVVCLQETKCLDEQFPREPIEELGYNVEVFGEKTYNGVAILSRSRPEDVQRGLPGEPPDAQKRVIGATVSGVMILCVYVVNGKQVGSGEYARKLEWLRRLRSHLESFYDPSEKIVVAGDFNITVDDRDVYDPGEWKERILCSTPEREALAQILDVGFADALRHHHPEPGLYTWWDFRTGGFGRGRGLRIDHLLLSPRALEACTAVEVDLEARKGKTTSDHAPVIATLS